VNSRWYKSGQGGLKVALAIAGVFIVLWLIFVSSHGREDTSSPKITPVAEIPTKIVLDNGMTILFPREVRCDDAEVNRFVSDFLSLLAAKDYKQYRLKVTHMREPIDRAAFEKAYDFLKEIKILELIKISDPKIMKEVGLEDVPPPAYRLRANAMWKNGQERNVEIRIFRENGQWVSSN